MLMRVVMRLVFLLKRFSTLYPFRYQIKERQEIRQLYQAIPFHQKAIKTIIHVITGSFKGASKHQICWSGPKTESWLLMLKNTIASNWVMVVILKSVIQIQTDPKKWTPVCLLNLFRWVININGSQGMIMEGAGPRPSVNRTFSSCPICWHFFLPDIFFTTQSTPLY